MCLYHEENKQAKQTDIGGEIGNKKNAIFGSLREIYADYDGV
jgi:hypothetical protein